MKRLRPSDDDDDDCDYHARRDLPFRKRHGHDYDHHHSASHTRRPPYASPSPSPSPSHRDFPKGFRSDRDRSRRHSPCGWSRSASLKDFPEDRSRHSPGHLQPRKSDTSGPSSDVEEGEFEPDPEPEKPELRTSAEEKGGEHGGCRVDRNSGSDSDRELEDGVQKTVLEPVKVEKLVAAERFAEEARPVEVDQVPAKDSGVEKVGMEKIGCAGSTPPVVGLLDETVSVQDGCFQESASVAAVSGLAAPVEAEVEMESVQAVTAPVADDGKLEDGVHVAREEGNFLPPVEQGEGCKGMELDVKVNHKVGIVGSAGEASGSVKETLTLGLLTNDSARDKGKAPVTSPSHEGNSLEESDTLEGSSGRGFELVFHRETMKTERMATVGIVIGKSNEDKPKLEALDLSLGLPGASLNPSFQKPNPKPNSPQKTRSFQSFASSFRTNSDDFTTSISLSGSQTFVHNPSCSLQQNSMENFEHSVHSRPLFQGIDQNTDGTIWQGQPSNDVKQKGEAVPLYQRVLLNGNSSHYSGNAASEHPYSKSNGPNPQLDRPRHLHSVQSYASQETRSDYSRGNKILARQRSSNSLFRGDQRDTGLEKFLTKVVSEPVQSIGRRIQEITEHSVLLKDAVGEMLVSKDRHGELLKLQEVLSRRSDLTLEILSKCPRVLLEILVAIKTGLRDFLRQESDMPLSYLADVFLNTKCRNINCRSNIPVDECDCKVCSQRSGFCSSCMCLICSKFDLASNTCSWVGCDVCLHWCHTDCGLHNSYIRNGQSTTGAPGTTEIQFHCIACDHTSEMFGFVKDVFFSCAKEWNAETLAKELEYVRKIFSASVDSRGKKLQDMAIKLVQNLENKSNLSEVYGSIMEFLAESDSNVMSNNPPAPSKEPVRGVEATGIKSSAGNGDSNGNCLITPTREQLWQSSIPVERSSEKPTWYPTFSLEKSPRVEVSNGAIPSLDADRLKPTHFEVAGTSGMMSPSFDYDKLGRRTVESEIQRSLERRPVLDELDNIIKFKQEEAKMYQSRADEARREAEGLKRIAIAKSEKIDEEYSNRITKLRVYETEEKRRQKVEDLHALERAQNDYFSMKMRMEVDIKTLLLKMEAVKHNLRT